MNIKNVSMKSNFKLILFLLVAFSTFSLSAAAPCISNFNMAHAVISAGYLVDMDKCNQLFGIFYEQCVNEAGISYNSGMDGIILDFERCVDTYYP